MAGQIYLPNVLLSIPRNPVTAVGLPLALGFLRGSLIHDDPKRPWIQKLCPPPGHSPTEVFPIIWPVFYMSMGYVSHLAVKALGLPENRNASLGLAIYYLHLGLNLGWNPISSRTKRTGLGFANSAVMTVTALCMMKLLDRPTHHEATLFLLPYSAWLAYMTYLKGAVWWLDTQRKDPADREEDDGGDF
ncbi:hypothetical protein APHAL10511_001917 [Amanita phalloides]|nr:hypothetical protein APHAL10511_001917 [Amanita phalloides]